MFWDEDDRPRQPKKPLLDGLTAAAFTAARYGNPPHLAQVLMSAPHLVDAQDEDDDNPLHSLVLFSFVISEERFVVRCFIIFVCL